VLWPGLLFGGGLGLLLSRQQVPSVLQALWPLDFARLSSTSSWLPILLLLLSLIIGAGLLLWHRFSLKESRIRFTQLHWPEWVLVLLIVGLLASIFPNQRISPPDEVYVPIPADRITGGISSLYPGKIIDLIVFTTATDTAPEQEDVFTLQVRQLQQGTTNTVLVSLPPDQAADLQRAVANDETKLVYQILPGTATPTLTATPITTPMLSPEPITQPTLIPENVSLELRGADIQPRPEALTALKSGMRGRLVIITQSNAGSPATTTPLPVTPLPSDVVEVCVQIVAFVDDTGVAYESYDSQRTPYVIVHLPSNQFAQVARGLTRADQIWLVGDTTCK
jgi:hypothetical protein